MEICYYNIWGSVCDDMWDAVDAKVACYQLGYSTLGNLFNTHNIMLISFVIYHNPIGATAERGATYGRGSGGLFLDDVQCNGTEARLFDCPRAGTPGQHNCYHAKDAGVTCTTSE